ncbi:unnamed protein product [Prunus armeniaca]|uniref:Uncharacterized protein n=1 Tax=Prunus armeniaca TaxID=36596 RepID=A0A6J5WMV0_PRUAR|nr:unnamed protein product [Prunus armeniaca]CAB4300604.1 unnamed protein product [Prunus armeniaca]
MASWPSSSNPSNQKAAIRKRSTGSQFKFLVAPIYAHVLPLIRLSLGKNSVVRLPFVY